MTTGKWASAMRTGEMAAVLGVDIQRALARGDLSVGDWREAVVACSGCARPLICCDWMEARAAARPVQAPVFCANLLLIETLQNRRG